MHQHPMFQISENKTRQGWVSFLGNSLEKLIMLFLRDFCKKNKIYITSDKKLRGICEGELDLVKRNILVHYKEYSLLPDADIILYLYNKKKKNIKVISILSVKNSFRERYTETPYWKLKLKENSHTKHIKVFMISPDKDNEISLNEKRKARIVMEYELDGIYLTKKELKETDKIKHIRELKKDILMEIQHHNEKA